MADGSRVGKPGIRDVARRAGVSATTVSLALNGKGRISGRTREAVLRAAAEAGFIPNRSAARLRSGRSALIGLVVSDISNPFYAEFSAEMERTVAAEGFLPVLANSGDDPARQARVLDTLLAEGVAGLIVSAATGSDEATFEALRQHCAPYVLCVRDVGDTTADFVGFDNIRAGVMAGRHLAGRGHRDAVFIGGLESHLNFRERREGVRIGLGAEAPLRSFFGPPDRATGLAGAAAFLADRRGATAVICFNDLAAAGVYGALSGAGVAIGRDVAVIGFDNIPETSAWTPPLTTVELFPRGLGARAARALLARIGGDGGMPERILISPRLVERQSA